ncbi:MAG TPA: hypothetical protein QGF58_10320 [Myxococcota bacterium]|nr:hypothetical protein [Myxococcota bacterium]
MSLALLLACSIENGIVNANQDVVEPVAFAPTIEYPNVDMSVDVALQKMEWGDSVTRCQIQVAFHKLAEGEAPVTEHGGGEEGGGNVIDIPDAPGTCLFSELDYSGSEQGPPSEDETYGDDGTDPDSDNWQEAGNLSGAPEIYLHSVDRTIVLHRQPLEDGRVRYEWDGCDADTFPFGEVFDIEVPNSDEDDSLPGFYVVEAFGIGTDMELGEPVPNDTHRLSHANHIDLWSDWRHLGQIPEVRGQDLLRDVKLFIRNYEHGGGPEFEALACDPPGDWSEIRDDDLQSLTPNATSSAADAPLYAAFQVDAHYDSPEIELPWGQTMRIRSTITEGGTLHLWEDDSAL